jgi:catalase
MVAGLRNVDADLAQKVADGLGMRKLPDPLPRVGKPARKPEVTTSPTLSLFARPGEEGIKTRRVAILVADGVDGNAARKCRDALAAQGAVPRFVAPKLGSVSSTSGAAVDVDLSFEIAPPVVWDGVVVPGGEAAAAALSDNAMAKDFVRQQHRHCKTMLALDDGAALFASAGVPPSLPSGEDDPGVIVGKTSGKTDAVAAFVKALAKHRHYVRETDPPAA